jgi:hypothetical protein
MADIVGIQKNHIAISIWIWEWDQLQNFGTANSICVRHTRPDFIDDDNGLLTR